MKGGAVREERSPLKDAMDCQDTTDVRLVTIAILGKDASRGR